jgi:hypothetical protein
VPRREGSGLPRRGPTYDLKAFRQQVRERYCGRKESAERKQKILDGLSTGISVSKACTQAGISPWTAKDWKKRDPIFKRLWAEAVEAGIDCLDDEATRRARDGVEKPVFYQGEQVAVVQEYSDSLLQFLLKSKRYIERRELTGAEGAPLMPPTPPAAVIPWGELENMSDAELQRLYSEQAGETGPSKPDA